MRMKKTSSHHDHWPRCCHTCTTGRVVRFATIMIVLKHFRSCEIHRHIKRRSSRATTMTPYAAKMCTANRYHTEKGILLLFFGRMPFFGNTHVSVVTFGRHKGRTFAQVYQSNPHYITWMAARPRSMSEGFNHFREYCITITRRKLVYVLPLRDSKYYVGITSFPPRRLWQHRNGNGSRWTRIHRPVNGFTKLQAIPPGVTPQLFEDMLVKELMLKYGLGAVRGGSYSNIHLDPVQVKALSDEMAHASRQQRITDTADDPPCIDAMTPPPKSGRRQAVCSSPCRLW